MKRVGTTITSKFYGDFLIKEKLSKDYYLIEFANTGYVTKSQIGKVIHGLVKDHLAPSVFGVGVTSGMTTKCADGKTLYEYNLWCGMLERCYSQKYLKKKPTYVGCGVSNNFTHYGFFKSWCEDQVGYKHLDKQGRYFQLDKDLLLKGNKVYSEDACVFLPHEINSALTSCNKRRGDLYIGVTYDHSKVKKYQATLSYFGKNKRLARCDTAKEAFYVYKKAKEDHLKTLATKWKGEIDDRAYEALMNYQIEITD